MKAIKPKWMRIVTYWMCVGKCELHASEETTWVNMTVTQGMKVQTTDTWFRL